jgi:thiosulfate dehydrogenase
MTSVFLKFAMFLLFGTIAIGARSTQVLTNDLEKPSEAWKLSRGGQIYDNWPVMFKSAVPSKTHPAYPAMGKKQGRATWRCKECHGWDYNGRDGAYRKGSHYTGIKGVQSMVGKPVDSIKRIIRDSRHSYSKSMIPDKELDYLAYFVSRGQVDMAKYIDTISHKVKGNVKRGANFFQTICAVCHGMDGKKILFHGLVKKPEYIGTVANKNPWEIFHKVRNGQPGAVMVSLRTFSIQDQLDIIAYIKLLPIK